MVETIAEKFFYFFSEKPLGNENDRLTMAEDEIDWGYYTVARRCEFYVLVARPIPREWAQQTSEILFLPREHKIHIFELTCNARFIILAYWWPRFSRFSEDFRPLSENSRRFSLIVPKGRQTSPNTFRNFPKIFEDCGRLPKIVEDFRGRPEDVLIIQQRTISPDNMLIIPESEAGGLTDKMTQKIAARDIQRVKALFLP